MELIFGIKNDFNLINVKQI